MLMPAQRLRVWSLVLVALGCALAVACGQEREPDGAGVSGRGVKPRVVSLVPAATEMLFAIGAGPQIVGVSSFDERPTEVLALPKVGALLDPDLERILALKPDLVVTYGSQEALDGQLAQAGIETVTFRHGGIGDTLTMLEDLAARTGRAEAGRMVANGMRARFDAVRMQAEGQPRLRTLLVFGREPGTLRQVWASGGRGFLHDLLDVAGADNVFAGSDSENVQATTEVLLASAPDVIVELRRGSSGDDDDEALRAWQALGSIPAVRDGRVLRLDGDDFVIPGPRLVDAAETLARALHGVRSAR